MSLFYPEPIQRSSHLMAGLCMSIMVIALPLSNWLQLSSRIILPRAMMEVFSRLGKDHKCSFSIWARRRQVLPKESRISCFRSGFHGQTLFVRLQGSRGVQVFDLNQADKRLFEPWLVRLGPQDDTTAHESSSQLLLPRLKAEKCLSAIPGFGQCLGLWKCQA